MNVAVVTQLVTRIASSRPGVGPRLVRGQVSPCLQSMAKMSSTVYGLACSGLLGPSEYSNVQVCWCRLWVSSRPADGHLERGKSAPGFPLSTSMDRCEDDQGASH